MKEHNTRKGYTIIELTLSMAFVGTLLVTIAIITLNIISVYQKGLSLRAVNSTGRELVSEFTNAIESAPVKSIPNLCARYSSSAIKSKCEADKGQMLVYQENHSSRNVNLNTNSALTGETTVTNPPTHGAFCTGRYSFIWNTGYVMNPAYGLTNERAVLQYTINGSTRTKSNFRLIRVEDQEHQVCSSNINNNYDLNTNNRYNLGNVSSESQISADFLDTSESNLAIYDLQVFVPTQHHITAHAFYSGTFILATLEGNVNIKSTGNYCNSIPADLGTDFAYCAINKFNFAAQATGELNENEQRQQRRS